MSLVSHLVRESFIPKGNLATVYQDRHYRVNTISFRLPAHGYGIDTSSYACDTHSMVMECPISTNRTDLTTPQRCENMTFKQVSQTHMINMKRTLP